MHKFLYILSLTIFLAGCNPTTETHDAELGYQIHTTVYKTPDCEPETDACLMASITYPRFNQGDSLAVILANRIVKNSILDAIGMSNAEATVDLGIDESLAEMDKEFAKLKKEFNNYNTGWSIEINTRELFNADTVLVLEIDYMTYTGGAHGNHNIRYFNFDKATGRLIPLANLAGDLDKFTAKAESVFKETYNLKDTITYEDAGFTFLGNKFTLAANYAFLGDSIRLHYNPYEIAAYAAGDFEITVTLK